MMVFPMRLGISTTIACSECLRSRTSTFFAYLVRAIPGMYVQTTAFESFVFSSLFHERLRSHHILSLYTSLRRYSNRAAHHDICGGPT
jgi:hypothetical protein